MKQLSFEEWLKVNYNSIYLAIKGNGSVNDQIDIHFDEDECLACAWDDKNESFFECEACLNTGSKQIQNLHNEYNAIKHKETPKADKGFSDTPLFSELENE